MHHEARKAHFEATRGSPCRSVQRKVDGNKSILTPWVIFREAERQIPSQLNEKPANLGSVLERQRGRSPASKTKNQRNFPAGKKRPNFRPRQKSQTPACREPCVGWLTVVGPRERWEKSRTRSVCVEGGGVLATVKMPFDQVRFELHSLWTMTCSSVGRAFAR